MKKMKGVKRRGEGELEELKSDELCGAVMEGLSEDYLGYISKLIKQNKTPAKPQAKQDSSSSDESKPPPKSPPAAIPMRGTPRGQSKEIMRPASKRASTLYVSSSEEPHLTPADRFKSRIIQTPSKLFISDIDNYLLKLQTKVDTSKIEQSRKQQTRKKSREHFQRSRQKNIIDKQSADVYEIMKENLKLKKKLRSYQNKIEQLQEEVSEHLMQCKKRDNNYKTKIGDLIKLLDHASGRIGEQKRQLQSMKGLLKSFGKKARHIERQETEDDLQENIRDSLLQIMRQPVTEPIKPKKVFNSTLPRKEENW